jgi:lycopene beta-cyclase
MFDIIFVGGGLAASLTVYLLKQKIPSLKVLVLEAREPKDMPSQTWSFQTLPESVDPSLNKSFASPLSAWFNPLITKSWASYDIRFPSYQRSFAVPYHSMRSEALRAGVQEIAGSCFRFGSRVASLQKNSVTLQDGETLTARILLDSRGWSSQTRASGYQKFVGLNLRLKEPHGLSSPVLMDCTIPQVDGFRFFYLLPWSDHEILIEDTRYSNTPELDQTALHKEILSYALRRGFRVESILGLEHGSLALPGYDEDGGGDFPEGTLGVRAGFYHPTTGYSVYEAVQTAEFIASRAAGDLQGLPQRLKVMADQRWRSQEFYRRLNNMLFYAAKPSERYRILERFYEHDAELIARFYAGKTSLGDKLRIMSGKPPIPMQKAVYHFFNRTQSLSEVHHA